MKLQKRGWLNRYLTYRAHDPFELTLPTHGVKIVDDEALHNEIDEAIYYHLQPTGMLYGLPTRPPFANRDYPRSRYFDAEDWVILTFLESLFSCMVADRHFLLAGLVEEEDRFAMVLELVQQYFLHGAPEGNGLSLPGLIRSGLSRVKLATEDHPLELELKRRVRQQFSLFTQPQLFANSTLFLDLHGCIAWQRHVAMEGDAAPALLAHIYEQQTRQRVAMLQMLAAAAWADDDVGQFEGALLRTMLRTSGLRLEQVKPILTMINKGTRLDDVQLPEMPWIVRRFLLELVLLMVMIDQEFSDSELAFVQAAVERLELWPTEFEQSKTALEIFLSANADQIDYLNIKPAVFNFSNRIQKKATLAVRDNMDRVVNEIKETHELYTLLMKATRTKLTPEERRKVNDQMVDILKTIPALAIFALPGGGLMLPILIRLLPFNLLPSSFED